jgi:hypothetical protein
MRNAMLIAALLLPAAVAHADNAADTRRAIMERDQMSEDFARGLRQYRQRMDVPSGDPQRSQALEQQFIRENQAADSMNAQQQLEMRLRNGGAAGAEYDAQRFAAERRAADARAVQEREDLRRDEDARKRREQPEPYTPTLDPPVRWGPTL